MRLYASVNSRCPSSTTADHLPASSVPGVGDGTFWVARESGICKTRDHPQACGSCMHPCPNITKHGGLYQKHKQIQRLAHRVKHGKNFKTFFRKCFPDFMTTFLHCLSSQMSGAIDVNRRIVFWLWNEIFVDLGFEKYLEVL